MNLLRRFHRKKVSKILDKKNAIHAAVTPARSDDLVRQAHPPFYFLSLFDALHQATQIPNPLSLLIFEQNTFYFYQALFFNYDYHR